jgi:S-formylglutathione hydrolase FrmB
MAGQWHEDSVGGHPCDRFEPSRPSEHGYVVLYLHGVHLNRLVDNAVFTGLFERYGLRAVCPMTRRSWWTDRICEEFDPKITAARHVLDNVLPYIQQICGAGPPRIALLGTSMGGQGALKFAFLHPNTFPIVAAISPAIDYQTRMRDGDETLYQMYSDPEAARQDTATLHVHPLNWPRNIWFCCDPADHRWHDSADRLRMKLYSLGIPHECDLETSAGGHSFDYYNHIAPKALAFIVERLERERLRVV